MLKDLLVNDNIITFRSSSNTITLSLLKNKLAISSITFTPFNDTKWLTLTSENKRSFNSFKIKLKCCFFTLGKHQYSNSCESAKFNPPLIKYNSISTSSSKKSKKMKQKIEKIQKELDFSLLEKNFDTIITTDNILTQNDSNILDIQGRVEEECSIKEHIEDIILDDYYPHNNLNFKQLKGDFDSLYTDSYISSIPSNYAKMKYEFDLVISKTLELSKSYHVKVNKKHNKYIKMKEFYIECAVKYMNLNKKLQRLLQKKKEIENKAISVKGKTSITKSNRTNTIKEEFQMMRNAGSWGDENIKKDKLTDILYIVGIRNMKMLDSSQNNYMKKLLLRERHKKQIELKKKMNI